MFKGGLVSISFRNLTYKEIITMVAKTNVKAIEWGGDLHVPHGDKVIAKKVKSLCRKNDIDTPSYGSYYKVGEYKNPKEEFQKVIDSAIILEVNTIRIWAGIKGSEEASDEYNHKIVNEVKMLAKMLDETNISISFEFHGNTLTDTYEGTKTLLTNINCENVYTYWQPPVGTNKENNIEDMNLIIDKLTYIHAFQWDNREKLELSKGKDVWIDYLSYIKKYYKSTYVLLEFVKDNCKDQFLKDAITLEKILERVNG